MRFKKVYLEITNICNLNCSFCPGNNRVKNLISIDDFNLILNSLEGYTKYLYFHLMGEPLFHPDINNLIDIASSRFYVNITTNGYLISRIANNKNIRQVNISLQAFDNQNKKELTKYLNNIYDAVDNLLLNNTIINLRIWQDNKDTQNILKELEKHYNVRIAGNTKIKANLYVDFAKNFIWPDINNDYCNENGSCKGLIDHIGILVDGTVVPCCLDYNGSLKLGNIKETHLDQILNQEKALKMIEGFKQNKKCEKMCQHCNFYDRIKN